MEATPSKPATIYDVARVAGVSHQSVSRYLRGISGQRSRTAERIEAALAEVDYRANITARNLRRGRTGMIALSIPSLDQPYFAELAQAVIRAAREVDLTVFVETTENDRRLEQATLEHFGGDVVDGVIFAPNMVDRDDLQAARVGIPLVLLGDRIVDSGFDHVTMSNRAAADAAVTHLLEQGRTRIVALGAEPHREFGAATPRLRGYQDAHDRFGVPVHPELAVVAGTWLRSDGSAGMQALIDRGEQFDAVFAFNDALALGALRALQSSGRRVPGDVALVGFDDTQDARYSTPSLTSIEPGRHELVKTAVAMLQERIDGSTVPAREREVGFSLQVRESSVG
ncbi:MAG: LacI family transcriptional regulator [Actinobacteria bacterium]|nr:LacI family transcriptional regulator [Actinomycetota bacterium]